MVSNYVFSFALHWEEYITHIALKQDNGDGICCKYGQGYFRLYFTRGGREIHSSSFEFGREEDIVFDVTDRDIDTAQKTDVPSISLMPSTSYSPSIAQSISNTSIVSWSVILTHVGYNLSVK